MTLNQLKLWNKGISAFVIFNGLLLFIFILILGYYYRLVPEDYYALQGNHKYGVLEQAKIVCNQWGGRYFSYLLSFMLLYFYEKGWSFAWYFFAGNTILLISFYSIISYISNRYKILILKSDKVAFAFLTFIALFYLTPGIHESWFWVAASTSYYWGLVMAISGCAFLCHEKISWYHFFPASVCFLYACSASEPFALMILLFLLLVIIRFIVIKNKKGYVPLAMVLVFAIAGFLFMYFAKGTSDRWLAMPDLTLATKVKRCAGAVFNYYMHWFPGKLGLALLFAPILLLTGNLLRTTTINIPKISFLKFLLLFSLSYTAIIFLSFAPSCYVMGEAGPLRSWHHIGIYNVVFGFVFFLHCGYYYGPTISKQVNKIKYKTTFFTYYLVVITCLHFAFLSQQVYIVKKYTKAVDERIALLNALQQKNYKGTLILDKLPKAGLLFSAEIGTDKDYYLNTFLKEGLGLGFEVRVREVKNLH